MVKEHLLLREYSGKPWSHGSLAREYLEKLPVANAEENFKETDTRYLLPRKNIFTFGLQNGITERVIYYTCNMCHAFVKPHDVKQHMITRHPKQEGTSGCSNLTTSTPPTGSKSKKSSHKSKKKVVPPPSVPPPPLFPKVEFPPPSTLSASSSSSEDLLPPVLQPVETVEAKITSSHKSEKNDSAKVDTVSTVTLTTTTTTVSSTSSSTTATATVSIITTSSSVIAVPIITTAATSTSILPPTLPTEASTKKSTTPPTVASTKTREKSSKSERDSYKRKRSKRSKKSDEFDPDKHCGVLDSLKRPCMRTLTCANHTIIERRAVAGRSKNVDKLILEYKASRVKIKMQPVLPVSIAPKQCSSLKEVRNGLRVIELIYENDSQNNLGNSDFKCPDDPIMSSVLENLASITHCVPKAVKPQFYVPPSAELEQVARVKKLPSGTFLKVSLSQSSPPLPGSKAAEVPSQAPTLYSAHPKPMTMLTSPLRRVGSSFVLQQQAQRLERQRLDLQAVVNQHKQLKVSPPNKQVSLLNSNHNKQSILKSNVKNNAKVNPLKRPSLEKTSVNDIKHMKVISADMNGFILNTDFTDSNETQQTNTVQDKIGLLK